VLIAFVEVVYDEKFDSEIFVPPELDGAVLKYLGSLNLYTCYNA
jgi:hypothetical protein